MCMQQELFFDEHFGVCMSTSNFLSSHWQPMAVTLYGKKLKTSWEDNTAKLLITLTTGSSVLRKRKSRISLLVFVPYLENNTTPLSFRRLWGDADGSSRYDDYLHPVGSTSLGKTAMKCNWAYHAQILHVQVWSKHQIGASTKKLLIC